MMSHAGDCGLAVLGLGDGILKLEYNIFIL